MNHKRVSIKVGREVLFFEVTTIIYVKAENIYTNVFTTEGKSFLATQTMTEMEEKLKGTVFFKPHRSYLININHINRYLKSDAVLYLINYTFPIPVSRNKKKELIKLIL